MAVDFNTHNQINIAGFTVPSTNKTTISFWLYLNSFTGSIQRLLGCISQFEIRMSNTGLISNDIYEISTTAWTTALGLGQWYHIVCTGDQSSGNATNYLNGILELTQGGQTFHATSATMALGTRFGSSQRLDGRLADVRIYDRVLSAKEVATIYAARGVDGIVDGLMHRWMLNEKNIGSVVGASDVKDLIGGLNGSGVTSPVYAEDELRGIRKFR